MDPKTTNFRVILALTNLPQDINLNGASLKITLASTTKTVSLANKEATPLDFSGVLNGSKIEFGLEDAEGFMFGYSELKIPTAAFEKNECEVNEQLKFYLINKEKDAFTASVYVIFLNKALFKEKARERGSATKTPKKSIPSDDKSEKSEKFEKIEKAEKSERSERTGSKSPARSPGRLSPSKRKSTEAKSAEKNLHAYLARLVDSHSNQLKNLVDEHNSINEYIHLNKSHNNLPQGFGDDKLETYSPTKVKKQPSLSKSVLQADNSEADSPLFLQSSKEISSIVRVASPERERAKRSANLPPGAVDEEVVAQANTNERSKSPSPMRLERKLSEGSSQFGSPTKRKTINEMSSSMVKRETVDVTFYTAQISTLSTTITNLNARIADLEIHRRENEELRAMAQRSESARKSLQESVLETTNELRQENRELERQVAETISEKDVLLGKISSLHNTVQELNTTLSATRANLKAKEDINTQNELKLVELSELKQQFKKLQEAITTSEAHKARDQESYKASLARYEVSLQDTKKTIDNLNAEKKKLVSDLHAVQQELGVERANHQVTQTELMLTKKRLENAENYKDVINSLESQRDQLTQQVAESRSNHAQTQSLLQESVEKLAERQREFEAAEKTFHRDLNTTAERLNATEIRAERVTKELNENKLRVSQLNSTVSGLEQLICVKEDVSRQLETATRQVTQSVEERKLLRAQLEAVCLSQEQLNARYMEGERGNNQLRQIIDEKEEQIEQLTYTVIALRESQDTYIPTKGDNIDNALADFINTGTEVSKMKLLFIREGEGVYQFGSKRVYVKLEGGKILIRVGGGFLTIEEFMEQYAQFEMEKLARTDPLKKLTKNIAVNKTLIGKCVSQLEKSKTTAYEYKTDLSGSYRIMNSSPTLPRSGSKGEN